MIELLKYCLPALIVLFATWLILYKLLKEEREKRQFQLLRDTQKEVTPIRLRGYERLSLLLERTTPQQLLRDLDVAGMSVRELQIVLMKAIRLEFDHNLSQQIYVSDATWDAIRLVQEEMLSFVTSGAEQFQPGDPALPYAQMLITAYDSNGETPTQIAQRRLRDEARSLLS
ncbi:MAG: hypothetical protein MJZ89_05795 [Paludibacteraceae bacterium]|nr:hypothetical protein [Paludibacteraceae bacterium]